MAKQLTTKTTEADLEARISEVLRAALPWVKADGLKHQTKFQFQFGGNVVDIDGMKVSERQARLDILITHDGKPLAVLELKRPDHAVTAADEEQGLSYARMLSPSPPLVVASNGEDTHIFSSYTGKRWEPKSRSEEELANLIASSGRIAAQDLDHAVEVLLGPGSSVWVPAVRAATEAVIEEQIGNWGDMELPFVANFLVPRQATRDVLAKLRSGQRIVIVEGAPLSGKSSVLRELAQATADSEDLAVLFIEADGGGAGIIQSLANILSDVLGWAATADDIRAWLRRLSHGEGPMLVLAVDALGPTRDEVRRDIEELTSARYGPCLRMLLAIDDTVADRLVLNETRRKVTAIGRRASRVLIEALSNHEFKCLTEELHKHRIGIMRGGEKASEFRLPWVIRALVADVVSDSQYSDESLVAELPPLLGPDLLRRARTYLEVQIVFRHQLQRLAKAVLFEANDRQRSASLVLESMATFVIRRAVLRNYLDSREVDRLVDVGLTKISLSEDNESILVSRRPELVASEVAIMLSQRLSRKISDDPNTAADWLVRQTQRLPMGDVIGAQAIFDSASELGEVPLDFISRLLSKPPERKEVKPGTRFLMHHPEVGSVKLTFRDDGKILLRRGATQRIVELDEDEGVASVAYTDFDSWLILSHVAGHALMALSPDGELVARVDPAILMAVGGCPIVLQRPNSNLEMTTVLTHDIKGHGAIVCHNSGIVEPITLSLLKFLDHEAASANDWLEEAAARESLPLLARIDIALRYIASRRTSPKACWAQEAKCNIIDPAFSQLPRLY